MNDQFEYNAEFYGTRIRYARGRSIREGNEIHSYHEILFFIKGGGRLFTEDFEATLDAPTLCILPKNSYHRFTVENQDEYTRIAIGIDSDSTEGIDLGCRGCRIISPLTPSLDFILERLKEAITCRETAASRTMIRGAVMMLIAELADSSDASTSPERRAIPEAIEGCIEYIEKHLSSPIKLCDIAREAGLSETALSRLFQESLGISVYRYVTKKRIARAEELLLCGELPTKIYADVGFGDYATFYKAYRKERGKSPSSRR